MAELNIRPPNLPLATEAYDRIYQDQLNNTLRLFFAQLNNPGDMGGTSLNLNLTTLPTEASFNILRLGDVYRNTLDLSQPGSNELRIKTATNVVYLSGVSAAGKVGTVVP